MPWTFSLHAAVIAAIAAASAFAIAPSISLAQAYPVRPVRVVLALPPGGAQDNLARAAAQELTKVWGQTVLIENRPGAGGILAAETVARSAPDGYTILMVDKVPLVNNIYLQRSLPFDPVKDFAPVVTLALTANWIVANNNFPANTVQELIAYARARPGQINYGTFGPGSVNHIQTEEFSRMTGIKLTHIPYKGGADLVRALLSGEVSIAFNGVSGVPAMRQKQLKAIAYGGLQRTQVLPDVPTIEESGVTGLDARSWFGWVVPAATPRTIIDRIATDTAQVVAAPAFRDKYIVGIGLEPFHVGPDAFAELLASERKDFEALIKRLEGRLN
jgi:tripartite-type tricarboxylate transporter receptor subunit TctC